MPLSNKPSDKPTDLRHKAAEQECSQCDLLAHGVELLHASFDPPELGLARHLSTPSYLYIMRNEEMAKAEN